MGFDLKPDDSFGAAFELMGDFLKDRKGEGPLATVSLARALGFLLVLTSKDDQCDMALGVTVQNLCDTFTNALKMREDGKL